MPESSLTVSKDAAAAPATPVQGQPETVKTAETPKVEGKKTGGFSDLPSGVQDFIRRSNQKAEAAEKRAMELERKMEATLARSPKQDRMSALSEDEREQHGIFEKYRQLSDVPTLQQVEELAEKKAQAAINTFFQKQREEKDRQELDDTLKDFDGTRFPKVSREELLSFLEKAESDPSLQYLLSAPYREIAKKMKEDEILQRRLDEVLKSGTVTPPKIETGAQGGTKTPEKPKIPKFKSDMEMWHALGIS